METRYSNLLKFCFYALFLSFSSYPTPIYCQSPALNTHLVPDDSTIVLIYQRPILLPSRLNFANLHFPSESRNPKRITLAPDEKTLTLIFPMPFPQEQEMSLMAGNVIDKASREPLFPTIYLIMYNQLRLSDYFGQVVFSELMFRPGPNAPLPNAEYIELRNLSSRSINLSRWSLFRGTDRATLGNNTLPPNDFALIVPSSKDSLFLQFSNLIAPAGFNALRNNGDTLTLRDHLNRTVATLAYTPAFFNTDEMPPLGTSIEVIDENNLSGSSLNWHASRAPQGGTPNAHNSVALHNPDTNLPQITALTYPTNYSLTIHFSHSIRFEELCDKTNFTTLENTPSIIELRPSRPLAQAVTLLFTSPLQTGILYRLNIAALTSFSGTVTTAATLEFELPVTPQKGDVVINEILHSIAPGRAPFVELYNVSSHPIDLSTLSLGYIQQSSGQRLLLPLTSERTALAPHKYVVITPSEQNIQLHYPSSLPRFFITPTRMPTLYAEEGTLILSNTSEEFEYVNYSTRQHSSMLSSIKGISLERISHTAPANTPTNWCSASFTTGYATPGLPNSAAITTPLPERFRLELEYFSPNNDGHQDQLTLHYSLPPNSIASMHIMDRSSRLIHTLMNNQIISGTGTYNWDGLTSNNAPLPLGIYILFIEWQADSGEGGRSRQPFVVSRK